ncbi:MAG: cold-shock protein [Magnetococcales bacterium]|nr:cold-shock protein [Magnetococcales bacterium]|tara:strand:+ start:437 stop:655 length:219 start_codon:yes stop_codon:yes gene_type:complete
MIPGKVKWFCKIKGYGFVEPNIEKANSDIFIHLTAVERSGYDELIKGQDVLFKLDEDPRKGRQTISQIKVVD